MCCGSVQHNNSCREAFKRKIKELIGDSFEQLSDIDKTAYVLGSEFWEENFEDMLRLLKEFIIGVAMGGKEAETLWRGHMLNQKVPLA